MFRRIGKPGALSTISKVDDPAPALSEVQYKAMCFEVSYKGSEGRVKPPYAGQNGLIPGERLTPCHLPQGRRDRDAKR